MEPDQTALGAETRALLAEQGIQVTDEGLARARQKLRDAEQRMTPEARAQIRGHVRIERVGRVSDAPIRVVLDTSAVIAYAGKSGARNDESPGGGRYL